MGGPIERETHGISQVLICFIKAQGREGVLLEGNHRCVQGSACGKIVSTHPAFALVDPHPGPFREHLDLGDQSLHFPRIIRDQDDVVRKGQEVTVCA